MIRFTKRAALEGYIEDIKTGIAAAEDPNYQDALSEIGRLALLGFESEFAAPTKAEEGEQ